MQLPLSNRTPFSARAQVVANAEGEDCLLLVAKASFDWRPSLAVASAQTPLYLGDRFRGAPLDSSLLYAGDIQPPKPAVDVLLEADAVAAAGRPALAVDVKVAVGSVGCQLRMHGKRTWQAGVVGPSEPFTRAPLIYELAAGGPDNPAGIGAEPRDGESAPQLEWLEADCPVPAGVGPLAAHWPARAGYCGTFDEQWRRQRAPFLPADFDARFWQLAPSPLRSSEPIAGAAVELSGVAADEVLRAQVPSLRLLAGYRERRTLALQTIDLRLDTLLLSVLRRQLVLTYRVMLQLGNRPADLTDLVLTAAP